MMMKVVRIVLLLAVVVSIDAKAISYRQGRNNKFYPDLVPVSSTVIPLEDLPEYKVGIGFHLGGMDTKLDEPIKLITAKKTKKPALAKVKQVSKKEFEKTG